jgi:RND family efflux transporter MFP subunit
MRFLFKINHSKPTFYKRFLNSGVFEITSRLFRSLLLCIFFLCLFMVPVVGVASPPDSGSAPTAPLVAVKPVIMRDINPPVDYVGHVEAIQSVDLRARVDGFLEKINFKEGDDVRSGDLLYVIEQAPYQAQVDSDKAGVAQAEAELARANQHLKRLQSALPESIPAMEMDEAVAVQLRAKAQIAQAQAALIRSQLDIAYTMIHAPISGRIGRTSITQGNLVGPNSVPLARIVQMNPIGVVFSISENDLTIIQPSIENVTTQTQNPHNSSLLTRLRLSDGTMFKEDGQIDFVNNVVDATTGTVAVRAVFDNAEKLLKPGQYVNVLLTLAEPDILPVVPQVAVQQDHKGSYVLIVDKDSKVEIRRVRTGPATDDIWAIESGVSEGEMVIVEGIQKVQPGITVNTMSNETGQGR